MSHIKNPQTMAGQYLRDLRQQAHMTQLELELAASLGIGYLQRLELGKVRQPNRETVERILLALSASYMEKRKIFTLFGYATDVSAPTSEEIDSIVELGQPVLDEVLFPAYILDYQHRLIAWNQLIPKLLALSFDQMNEYPISLPQIFFDAKLPIAPRIINPDVFYPTQVNVLKFEMQKFEDASWWTLFLEDMLHIHNFAKYWLDAKDTVVTVPARPLAPLLLDVGRDGVLQFRLIAETIAPDPRFRIIYYLPNDNITAQLCMKWCS